MRRKQVSKDDFLRSSSTNTNCPHIQSITPPLSPALSSVSPASQVDCHNADEKQRKYNRQTEHRFENSLAEFYLPQPHSQSGYRSILWCASSTGDQLHAKLKNGHLAQYLAVDVAELQGLTIEEAEKFLTGMDATRSLLESRPEVD
jgi:hypothetical protein